MSAGSFSGFSGFSFKKAAAAANAPPVTPAAVGVTPTIKTEARGIPTPVDPTQYPNAPPREWPHTIFLRLCHRLSRQARGDDGGVPCPVLTDILQRADLNCCDEPCPRIHQPTVTGLKSLFESICALPSADAQSFIAGGGYSLILTLCDRRVASSFADSWKNRGEMLQRAFTNADATAIAWPGFLSAWALSSKDVDRLCPWASEDLQTLKAQLQPHHYLELAAAVPALLSECELVLASKYMECSDAIRRRELLLEWCGARRAIRLKHTVFRMTSRYRGNHGGFNEFIECLRDDYEKSPHTWLNSVARALLVETLLFEAARGREEFEFSVVELINQVLDRADALAHSVAVGLVAARVTRAPVAAAQLGHFNIENIRNDVTIPLVEVDLISSLATLRMEIQLENAGPPIERLLEHLLSYQLYRLFSTSARSSVPPLSVDAIKKCGGVLSVKYDRAKLELAHLHRNAQSLINAFVLAVAYNYDAATIDEAVWAGLNPELGANSLDTLRSAASVQLARHPLPPAILHLPVFLARDGKCLLKAVEANEPDVCALLLRIGFSPFEFNPSPFSRAVSLRLWSIVSMFIDKLPDVDTRVEFTRPGKVGLETAQVTPLMILLLDSSTPECLQVAETLIARGADINARVLAGPNDGLTGQSPLDKWTPLHFAAEHIEATQLLLRHGVDVRLSHEADITPLHVACSHGILGVVELLLENGGTGRNCVHSPFFPAFESKSNARKDILRLLVTHPCGCDVNAQGMIVRQLNDRTMKRQNVSPLDAALTDCDVEVTRLLLDNGASVRDLNPNFFLLETSTNPVHVLPIMYAHGWQPDLPVRAPDAPAATPRGLAPPVAARVPPYALVRMGIPQSGPMNYINGQCFMEVLALLLDHDVCLRIPSSTQSGGFENVLELLWRWGEEVGRLLMDYGVPYIPAKRIFMKDMGVLRSYVPTPRRPTRAHAIEVGGERVLIMPWTPSIHVNTPREFRDVARVLAGLRMTDNAGENYAAWSALPLEVFELILDHLFHIIRTARALL